MMFEFFLAECREGSHKHAGISGCHPLSQIHKDPKVRHHATNKKSEGYEAPARVLGNAFKENNKQLVIVGGYVRDLMMGKDPHDMDLATDAKPEETKAILAKLGIDIFDIGEKFGTIGANLPEGKIEITTFRDEVYDERDRKPKVTFGTSLKEDLARRDFTFNSMAQDVLSGAVADPFDGLGDIKGKVVRAVGDPDKRFSEDPLRMLRAVRFAGQLGFKVDPATLDSIKRNAYRLKDISKERIADETTKILSQKKPSRGLAFLTSTGLMKHIVPQFYDLVGVEQSAPHDKDVFGHTLGVVDNMVVSPAGRWAAMLHDIAKPQTESRDERGIIHFYEHEHVGAEVARGILRDLKFSNQFVDKVTHIIDLHMRPNLYRRNQGDSSVRRLMRDAGDDFSDLLDLSRADILSQKRQPVEERLSDVKHLEERSKKIAAQISISELQSPLDGDELMQIFGKPPGRWIQDVKRQLTDMVVEGKLDPGDKNKARAIARKLLNA